VARIFILEPEPELRELLARVVARLGHEPIQHVEATSDVEVGDVVIVEPGDEKAYAGALAIHRRLPEVPIVCVSVYSEVPGDAKALDPVAHVLKPFRLAEVERAIETAVERATSS